MRVRSAAPRRRGPHSPFGGLVVLCVLLVGARLVDGPAGPSHPGLPHLLAARPASTPAAGGANITFHNNLLIFDNITAFHQNTYRANDTLTVQYQLQVANYTAPLGTFKVHVPTVSSAFLFNANLANASKFLVYFSAHNFTVNSSAPSDPTRTTVSVALPVATPGNWSGAAPYLSSGGIAVLSSLPYLSVAVQFKWSWTVVQPGRGAVGGSGWGQPWASVNPAQWVSVAYQGPKVVAAGTDFVVCVSGPVQNRTFSLHGEDPAGVEFARSTGTAPGTNSTPFCLSLLIPLNYTAQPVIIHVWEYAAITMLLHLLQAVVTVQPVGYVRGTVSPSGAPLFYDGVPIPESLGSSYLAPMTAGAHRVYAIEPGFWPQVATVNVSAGATTWVNFSLSVMDIVPVSPTAFGSGPFVNVPIRAALASALAVPLLVGVIWWLRRRPPLASVPPVGATLSAPSSVAPTSS